MKYLVLIIGLLLLCSCTEEVVNKPEDLIPEAQMVDIYFDISLINAARNSGYDKLREHGIDSEDYLYSKYDIDSAQLVSSAEYYTSKPLIHERIYTRVEERLDSLKSIMEEEMKLEQENGGGANRYIDSLQVERVADTLDAERSSDSLSVEGDDGIPDVEKEEDRLSIEKEEDSLNMERAEDSLKAGKE